MENPVTDNLAYVRTCHHTICAAGGRAYVREQRDSEKQVGVGVLAQVGKEGLNVVACSQLRAAGSGPHPGSLLRNYYARSLAHLLPAAAT